MRRSALIVPLLIAVLSGPAPAQEAGETLKKIGVTRGICVLVEPADAKAVLGLAGASELLFYVRSSDAAKVASIRQAAERGGLLGTRVYVDEGKADRLPLADNIVDAVIAPGGTTRKDILRVLRPGGKALLGGDIVGKPFPKGADEWNHPYHGPDNNPQSNDQLAKGPFITSFMAEPWYAAMHQVSVFGGGRIYKAFGNRTSAQPQWAMINMLVALNAWNGTMLWKRPLSDGFMIHRNTMIATPDALLLGDDKSVKVLDGQTGKVREEIVVPESISDGPVWKWMVLQDGILYALVGEKEDKVGVVRGTRFRGSGWPWWRIDNYAFGFGRTLLAMELRTKKILWTYRDKERLDSRVMGMGGGRITIYAPGKFLGAVDPKTGKLLWKNSDDDMLKAVGAQRPAQRATWGFASSSFIKVTGKMLYFAGPTQEKLVGVSAENGKLVFQHPQGNHQLIVRDDAVYALGAGHNNQGASLKLHPLTGEIIERFEGRWNCTRATASSDFIFTRGGRGGGTSVFDIRSAKPKQGLISPMRPACQDGVVVANGRFYWGPWICRCDTTQIGVINLGPAGSFDFAAKAVEADRLAGAGSAEGAAAAAADWPTYRRNNARIARTSVAVGTNVSLKWAFAPPGGSVSTAPIVVGDTAYVSGDSGIVRALDVASGKVKWTAYTGGAVKYPPTYWKGKIYVGSGDGSVYCLAAASGKTLWRFRAAPAERRIPVYGQLLSTWPVGSGVLVENGVAYAAAGITNYDGTHVYALDAETGKIRWQNHTSGHLHEGGEESGAGVQGHFLLHDGALYMSGGNLVPLAKYDLATGRFTRGAPADRRRVHGRDLYVLGGKIRSTGYPLYWRQEDQHFISEIAFPAPNGTVNVNADRVWRQGSRKDRQGKPRPDWQGNPIQEASAVAVAGNAVVIAGVDRTGTGSNVRISSWIFALSMLDGTELWRQELPAPPVLFGAAIDRNGRILVSLQNGHVLCYDKAR